MNFIKKHWKLLAISIGVIVLLFWIGSVTGTNSKLFNMALDNLRTDQSRIIKTLEENMTSYENEITNLQEQVARVQKDKASIQAQANQSNIEIARLKGKIYELQDALDRIRISDNPDAVIEDLHNYGIKSIHKR